MGAEAAISMVVKLLADVLKEKVNFLQGVEGQVGSLKDELNSMQSFLRGVNKEQAKVEVVRTWIEDIRQVAHDTEDTIEMFALNVGNAKSRGLLERWACSLNHLSHLDEIGNEIGSLRARLKDIGKRRVMYGIEALSLGESSSSSEVEDRRRLAPWEKDEHLVGLEDDVEKLVKQIMDEQTHGLSVSAIVGMGGIGKSTLAREVYNHSDLDSSRFELRAWVVVSSEFTPIETIKQLLELTSPEQQKLKLLDKIMKLEKTMKDPMYLQAKLKEMLHEQLKGKTYFIVLDDVWKKAHLDLLLTFFPNEQDKTNKLLFTSRDKDITNQGQFLLEMKLLDTVNSWKLFSKKVFTGNNSNGGFPQKIRTAILNKCQGLPLSITVMGGLLEKKLLNKEWNEVLDELKSLSSVENSISTIMELSYQNLSPELKCCFLCLAFFREDAAIPVKRVLNIMVGQGLIQPTGRTKAEEDIARRYLDELINRNLVQVKDLTLDGRVKSCHLHDSLRDLCLDKAYNEIGLENLIGNRRVSLEKPRHQVVYCDDLVKDPVNRNKHIRSIFVLNVKGGVLKAIKSSYWKSFEHLKTLDLEGNYPMRRLPGSFRSLLGLKQLRIHTNHQQPLELPTWLNKFKKLELLDMASAHVIFPKVALEMESLRHINASYIDRVEIGDSCKNLESLKYIKQRDWMKFSLRQSDDCHVRKLGILMDDPSTMRPSLEKLGKLVKLVLRFSYPPIDLVSIPRLINLTKLKLVGEMKRPSASMFPPNLSHLTLEESELDEDSMQELGKLQNLLYLKLNRDSYSGVRIQVLDGGFPTLRGLCLRELSKLRSVNIVGGMPQLKLLQIDGCPHLHTNNLSNKSYHLQTLNSKSVDTATGAAISTVVQLLAYLLIKKVNFIRGVAGEIVLLKDELTRMQGFLKDAEKKRAEDEKVRNWISEIIELVLDTEDTIEMFALNVETANSRGLLQGCACFPNHPPHLYKIRKEIQAIRARLVEIDKSRETCGITYL